MRSGDVWISCLWRVDGTFVRSISISIVTARVGRRGTVELAVGSKPRCLLEHASRASHRT
jgi:hypothetical protein